MANNHWFLSPWEKKISKCWRKRQTFCNWAICITEKLWYFIFWLFSPEAVGSGSQDNKHNAEIHSWAKTLEVLEMGFMTFISVIEKCFYFLPNFKTWELCSLWQLGYFRVEEVWYLVPISWHPALKKNTLPLGTIWMDSQFSQFLLTLNQDQDVFENVGFIII